MELGAEFRNQAMSRQGGYRDRLDSVNNWAVLLSASWVSGTGLGGTEEATPNGPLALRSLHTIWEKMNVSHVIKLRHSLILCAVMRGIVCLCITGVWVSFPIPSPLESLCIPRIWAVLSRSLEGKRTVSVFLVWIYHLWILRNLSGPSLLQRLLALKVVSSICLQYTL